MAITVGFTTHPGPLSWLIRKLTRSRVSHAWVVFNDPVFHTRLVLEATSMGFHLSPYFEWTSRNQVIKVKELPYPLEEGLHAVAKFLGSRYDVGGLLGMAAVVVGRWFRFRWKNPLRSSSNVFCSEAVVRILAGAGVPEADKLDPEATTPEDLLKFVEALPEPK